MLRRTKLWISLLAAGLALAVVPTTTASATIATSSICTAYTAAQNKEIAASSAIEKDIASGTWAKVQKALLSTFSSEASAEKQFATYLNGASAKVRAAAAEALKLDASFKKVIQKSKSLNQFESGINKAESTSKAKAAVSVLESYANKLCPSSTPTT
jgi:hypothetical protein